MNVTQFNGLQTLEFSGIGPYLAFFEPGGFAEIIQGSAASFVVRLINAVTHDPVDLTGVTHLKTCFANADGTELMLDIGAGVTVSSPATAGKFTVALTAAQSVLLAITDHETIEFAVTPSGGGDANKIQVPNAYAVLQSGC